MINRLFAAVHDNVPLVLVLLFHAIPRILKPAPSDGAASVTLFRAIRLARCQDVIVSWAALENMRETTGFEAAREVCGGAVALSLKTATSMKRRDGSQQTRAYRHAWSTYAGRRALLLTLNRADLADVRNATFALYSLIVRRLRNSDGQRPTITDVTATRAKGLSEEMACEVRHVAKVVAIRKRRIPAPDDVTFKFIFRGTRLTVEAGKLALLDGTASRVLEIAWGWPKPDEVEVTLPGRRAPVLHATYDEHEVPCAVDTEFEPPTVATTHWTDRVRQIYQGGLPGLGRRH